MTSRFKKLRAYSVSRSAEASRLSDDDFAFVFDSDGDIRCIQMPAHLDDNDEIPQSVDRFIKLIDELKLVEKLARNYH
jgi:hypothetical protein|tara:strand:- start:1563 stop:1796 length:234 start_codon:yes stop_codon:yes gene_type:complete